jgi:adenosylcobinamide-phosphate synthase
LVAGIGAFLGVLTRLIPGTLGLLSEAYILKTAIGLRGLSLAGEEVQRALEAGDLPEARRLLSWHLVSRDTSQLSAAQVAGATVESVAENASDGVLAPLFYYALGGLPAALAYRYSNTGDAMLGYHDAEREWLGKSPARWDDLLNLIPARLTALLLIALSPLVGADRARALAIWRRDARTTASPNAGHPMSAMAGALGVALEKVGHYHLGAGQAAPTTGDIRRSVRLVKLAAVAGAGLLALVTMLMKRNRQD